MPAKDPRPTGRNLVAKPQVDVEHVVRDVEIDDAMAYDDAFGPECHERLELRLTSAAWDSIILDDAFERQVSQVKDIRRPHDGAPAPADLRISA